MKRSERIEQPVLNIEVDKHRTCGFQSDAVFRFDNRLKDSPLKWLKWNGETNSYTSVMGETIIISGSFG